MEPTDSVQDFFPLRTRRITHDGPREIDIVLEAGPLAGERVTQVPFNAVFFSRRLDDGTVVSYRRWCDNVWRFDTGVVT
jgi:hypothetical protein